MKVIDIRRALTEKISKLGLKVYYENINIIKRPCYFIDLITYQKKWLTDYKEHKRLSFDILYFPANWEGDNTEIWEALEKVDDIFDRNGKKILSVLDRNLTLRDEMLNIVDKVGHYEFTLDLYDQYGKVIDYELMQELCLDWNKEGE